LELFITKARIDVNTGVAQGKATNAKDLPTKKLRTSDHFSISLLSHNIFPLDVGMPHISISINHQARDI
jgi:hypothetical protein